MYNWQTIQTKMQAILIIIRMNNGMWFIAPFTADAAVDAAAAADMNDDIRLWNFQITT